ncbi:MAG: ATP synthase subunit I [Candidatus Accumulibacter sp.]|jgi:F0F1-type ATP synthase assembly protein I|nr:ATP synthase subunit I [Accumulibacter sp.]
MLRVILLQAAAVVLASVIGGLIAGLRGGISSALGGSVCILPNLLLALYLKFAARRPGAGFLLSVEFVKLALIAGLLVVIVRGYGNDVHWPSLLIGLVLAIHAAFFWGFWKKN